jgi:ATP-dependent RNA helicase SUPV3L1/SUV3
MARGVAFQLVEALGVLERQRVTEEVKGLDQPARATLRKYGVRFGAYHIYVPLLLKPGPRALATQLWALKHQGPETHGLDTLLAIAASGRTSFPVDKETPKPLYRTAGYRVCGERAVRVDILERLADLIRPALAWREGSAAAKPAGAIDGGFTVTGAMTSLTGASGEDFASILRSLGYRVQRRPKPPETPATTEVAAPAAEAASDQAAPAEAPASQSLLPDAELIPAVDEAHEAAHETAEASPESVEPPAQTDAPETTETQAEVQTDAKPQAAEASAAEPAFIEVWRPGGRSDSSRHRKPHRPHERQSARSEGAAAGEASAAAEGGAPASTPSVEAPAQRQGRRPQRHRGDRKEQQARPERQNRPDRDRRPRPQSAPPRERKEKAPDPNSPFAKLAALKQQLEANAKDGQ